MSTITTAETAIEKKRPTPQFSMDQVTSADGTTIGYRQIGSGPGLVMLHGGTRASHHYVRLAAALADTLTVIIPDRRGRGLSGLPGEDYSLETEIADVHAVFKRTGARILFGHSAGGFFALEAALKLPVDTLILYEPAISINGSLPLDWVPSLERALSAHDTVTALVVFFKGLRLNWISKLPAWMLTPLMRMMLRSDEGGEMAALLPTILWEVKTFQGPGLSYERYRHIEAETLLLGGTRSPAYLLYALRSLAEIMPRARLGELPKLDHNAPDQNAPEVVAAEMRKFLA